MNIDKLKHQHRDILRGIAALRSLAHAGVEANAAAIAQGIVAMSGTIKLHLAVEDQVLYPALQRGGNEGLARMGRQYQGEMASIASDYERFARRWNTANSVRRDAQGFRADANAALRRVHERMQRETTTSTRASRPRTANRCSARNRTGTPRRPCTEPARSLALAYLNPSAGPSGHLALRRPSGRLFFARPPRGFVLYQTTYSVWWVSWTP